MWNRTYARGEKLCNELNSISPGQYTLYKKIDECVSSADVIVTATLATTPLIQYEWLRKGFHINGMHLC